MLDIAIIGGGPAGLAAGLKASSEGLNAAIFEASSRLGGRCASSPRIENIPGFPGGISGEAYGRALASQLDQFGCRVRLGARCVSIEHYPDGEPLVQFDVNDRRYFVRSRSVLITSGLTERRLQELDAVDGHPRVKYHCRPDDLHRHHGEKLLFIGGGNSSAQLGLEAADHGADVLILASRALLHNVSRFLLDRIQNHPRVRVAWPLVDLGPVVEQPAHRLRVVFTLDDTQFGLNTYSEDFDHVYAFAGGVGDVPFFGGEKAEDGRILTGHDVSDALEDPEIPYLTSEPGVFAAGDVRWGNTGSVAVAAGEGTQAVQTIAKVWLPERYRALEPLARN